MTQSQSPTQDERKEMLAKLTDSAIHFMASRTLDELYALIATDIISILHASHATIFGIEKDELRRVYSTSVIIQQTPLRKNGRTYAAFYRDEPFTMAIEKPEDIHPAQASLGVKQLLFVPLVYIKERIGVMNVFLPFERRLSGEEMSIVRLYASLVSLSIRNVRALSMTADALRIRDLFISFAAHELKTPLTVISLYSQMLGKNIQASQMPDAKIATTIDREVQRLTHLINELMQVSQIRTGQLHFSYEAENFTSIVDQALTDFQIVFPNRKLKFHSSLTSPAMIHADGDKILQVIINILNNAVKFSPEDSLITVALTESAGTYELLVSDQGSGIPKKHLQNIFKDFYKGESKKEGMGLGLYIVKQIVVTHGGDVLISSSPKGTAVTIVLPKL